MSTTDNNLKAQANNEALEAIAGVILNADSSKVEEIAKAIVVSIARKQIPHVEIKY